MNLSSWWRRATRAWPFWGVLLGFVGSRLGFAALGLELDDSGLDYFWQYQNVDLLRAHPFEAVLYQHTQPPLYNLFLALGLQFQDPSRFFRLAAYAFGLLLHLGLLGLMLQLGIRKSLAALGALLFVFSPASILMELWLFYTHPVAALLVLATLLLHRAMRSEKAWAFGLAFFVLALIVLTRSLFHLIWIVALAGVVLMLVRDRRRVALALLFPLLIASAPYLKNKVIFGHFEASSWLGFSLSRLVTVRAPRPLIEKMIAQKEISPLARVNPWRPLEHYPPAYRVLPEGLPRVPVLTTARRANGKESFNHGAYLRISRTFLEDAKAVALRDPTLWLTGTGRAWMIHYQPIHDYGFFPEARRRAGPTFRLLERFYEALHGSAFAAWRWGQPRPDFPWQTGWLWVLFTLGSGVFALLWAHRHRHEKAIGLTLLFCVSTIAFVAVVGNALELGENQRFRFLSEPFTYALIFFSIEQALRRRR